MTTKPETLVQRVEKLRLALLKTHDGGKRDDRKPLRLDGLIISDRINISYITGFTGSAGLALLMPDSAYLIVDSRYTLQARQESKHFEVIQTPSAVGMAETLNDVVARYLSTLRLGFEADNLTVAQLSTWKEKTKSRVKLKSTTGMVERLRAIKDADEITAIRAAIRLAESSFKKVSKLLVPGTVETKFALEIETVMRRAGAERAAFDTIVASGPNGARPHHGAGDRAFEAGDLVTIDWGAELAFYNSDLTRTVLIGGGQMDSKQRDVYQTVLDAKNLAIAAIRPGVTGKSVDDIARNYIREKGYGDYFGHSLGHGLGLVVHDGPTLSQRSENIILQPGMVTTVEPGIYIEGWGGVRIEDDILVTESGHELLSGPAE